METHPVLTIKVMRHWHRLPRDEVAALSLQTLRSGWGALSTDGAVGVPAHCRGLDQMAFKGPFQLEPFHDFNLPKTSLTPIVNV